MMVSIAGRLDKGRLLIYILSNALDLPTNFISGVDIVDGTRAAYLSVHFVRDMLFTPYADLNLSRSSVTPFHFRELVAE